MARQKQRTPATIYPATVRSALEHVADASWLGHHSPLASPYFLGRQRLATARPDEPEDRGRSLQEVIRQSVDRLWGGPLPATRAELTAAVDDERASLGSKSTRYLFYLLELRYLRRYYPPSTFPTSAESIPGFVNVSPTRFFIHLEEAISELGRQIIGQLNPALRLERPSLSRSPVGRDTAVQAVIAALNAGHSAAITGQGGVGKTTTAAAATAQWPGAVFWHTFHPGLNDDLNSVLFSIGHFMRDTGALTLWAQLLAGAERHIITVEALGMLRMDLEAIAARRPVLVFDEVDLLQTGGGDPRRKQHAQVLELIESLRGAVPLLLIGQRVYVDTETHIALEPLPAGVSAQLLTELGVETNAAALHTIQQFTGGNPRLLELYAALRQSGDEASDLLRLPGDAAAQPLFSRLWRRLEPPQREMLGALSVFRSYAPRDAWPKLEAVAADLIDRSLVKFDMDGGMALLPFFRELVYAAIPPAKRQTYHLDAARIRAQLGDYTAAAYHYVEGGDPAAAVDVWYVHQDTEVLAGQAATADEIFSGLDPDGLDESRQGFLLVIRNRLALLQGEASRVLEGMETFTWDADDETTANALGQLAYAHELRDQADQALARYDDALNMLSRLATKFTGWHMARSLTMARQADFQGALHEVQLAMIDIEGLQGSINYMASRLADARAHFTTALDKATEANDRNRIAYAHYGLAMIAGRHGDMPLAHHHAEIAMAHYAETGNRLQLEGLRAELAGMYLNVRQYAEVIPPSEKALAFFERVQHEVWIGTISVNLAEAFMETGQLDKARVLVFKVLNMEIPDMRPYALYTLGHIHDREGNPTHAVTVFNEGIEVARAISDPYIEALLQRAKGALLARDGQAAAAADHLSTALRLFSDMGVEHEVAATEAILRAQGGAGAAPAPAS